METTSPGKRKGGPQKRLHIGNDGQLTIPPEGASVVAMLTDVHTRIGRPEDQGCTGTSEGTAMVDRLHRNLYVSMNCELTKGMPEYQSFLTMARTCLPRGRLASNKENVLDVLEALESENWIAPGNYQTIRFILDGAGLHKLKEQIKLEEKRIIEVMTKERKRVRGVQVISECQRLHCELYEHVNRNLRKGMSEYRSFLTLVRTYIPPGKLAANNENIVDVLWVLETEGRLGVGDYDVLLNLFRSAGLRKLEREIEQRATRIQQIKAMANTDPPRAESSGKLHGLLFQYIHRELTGELAEYRSFLTTVGTYIPPGKLASIKGNIYEILTVLESENWIAMGNYKTLIQIVEGANLHQLKREIQQQEANIQQVMKIERKAVPTVKASGNLQDSRQLHRQLYECINRELSKQMPEYRSFLTIVRTYLPPGKLASDKENIVDILETLESENWIAIGNYETLVRILQDAGLYRLKEVVRQNETRIQQMMKMERIYIPNVQDMSERHREITRLHNNLYEHVNRNLTKGMHGYNSFLTMVEAYIPRGVLAANSENIVEVLCVLETEGYIEVGNYRVLLDIFQASQLIQLRSQILEKATVIQQKMNDMGISSTSSRR